MTAVTGYDALDILTGKNVSEPQIPVHSDAPFFFDIVEGALNVDTQVLKYLGVIGIIDWFFRFALSEYRVNKEESDQCGHDRPAWHKPVS